MPTITPGLQELKAAAEKERDNLARHTGKDESKTIYIPFTVTPAPRLGADRAVLVQAIRVQQGVWAYGGREVSTDISADDIAVYCSGVPAPYVQDALNFILKQYQVDTNVLTGGKAEGDEGFHNMRNGLIRCIHIVQFLNVEHVLFMRKEHLERAEWIKRMMAPRHGCGTCNSHALSNKANHSK